MAAVRRSSSRPSESHIAKLPTGNVDTLVDIVLSSTPLQFVREFLRSHKRGSRGIIIGATREEARRNLREAILNNQIASTELESWLREIEGWGRQHLYLRRVKGKVSTMSQWLNSGAISAFLAKRSLLQNSDERMEEQSSLVHHVAVDDVYGRLAWRAESEKWERREDLDQTELLNDAGEEDENGDEYVFRAWRKIPTRAASRFCLRKTDGAAIILLTQPLGESHETALANVERIARLCVAPLVTEPIPLSPVVGRLDESAKTSASSRARHGVSLEVEAREARFRAEGARVQFESTMQSEGYGASEPVRRVRQAMRIEKFVGERGKFGLTYDIEGRAHRVVASLDAYANRCYLFSRMTEGEVWALVDHLLNNAG